MIYDARRSFVKNHTPKIESVSDQIGFCSPVYLRTRQTTCVHGEKTRSRTTTLLIDAGLFVYKLFLSPLKRVDIIRCLFLVCLNNFRDAASCVRVFMADNFAYRINSTITRKFHVKLSVVPQVILVKVSDMRKPWRKLGDPRWDGKRAE